jgi:phosphate-selective porin OprO and OprP
MMVADRTVRNSAVVNGIGLFRCRIVFSLKFQGGYAEATYVLTGETRPYKSASASYGGIEPANPFSLTGGGWGAWEIAARYSTIDLNDRLGLANGVAGGRQTIYTLALN